MLEIDPSEPIRSAPGEQALWCAALTLLIEDAKGYVTGRRGWSTPQEVAQAAFEDVVSMGPMLRWCCDHTGHDPQWISEAFRREWSLDNFQVGERLGEPARQIQKSPEKSGL